MKLTGVVVPVVHVCTGNHPLDCPPGIVTVGGIEVIRCGLSFVSVTTMPPGGATCPVFRYTSPAPSLPP